MKKYLKNYLFSKFPVISYNYLLIREFLRGFENIRNNFFSVHGYHMNLKNPSSFSEKVHWKKIFDRDPLLVQFSDKVRVRDYVRQRLGDQEANKIFVPLLHISDDPSDIPFEKLPDKYIIKPNHMSGQKIMVDTNSYSEEQIITICKSWLKKPYNLYSLEWGYQPIKRKILIQPVILNSSGNIPDEYRFFCFNGNVKLVQADSPGVDGNTLFDRDGNELEVYHSMKYEVPVKITDGFTKMIEIAEVLSKTRDFIRVDFMSGDNLIYFNEITSYPRSGCKKFDPMEYDFELGKSWSLDRSHASFLSKFI